MHPAGSVGDARTWIVRAASVLIILISLFSQATPPGGIVAAATPPAAPPRIFVRRLGETASSQPSVGQPVRLKIPTIHVDAVMEDVGKTSDGAMDVPKDFNNTAWYDLGPRPGEQGNAVVAGHVDSTTGPAVFWDLHKLVSGDQIIAVGDDGVERTFVVTESAVYARADVPLDRVFGATTERHLNLITCDPTSVFDRTKGEYAANLVVYAQAA